MKITFEYLYDTYECDTCGQSHATGGRIWFDGKQVFELVPVAHCFGGAHMNESLPEKALRILGHEVEETCAEPA